MAGGGVEINNQSISPCKRVDIHQGKWVDRIQNNDNASSATTPAQYQWLPDVTNRNLISPSCQVQENFNTTLFSNLMTNAVIAFIRDSITFEMYASLVHLTGGKVTKRVHIRAVFNI